MMFEAKPFLEKDEISKLAKLLNASKESIVQWLQNRRYQARNLGSLLKSE